MHYVNDYISSGTRIFIRRDIISSNFGHRTNVVWKLYRKKLP